MSSSGHPQTTFSAALLIYMIFVVFFITLIPFKFRFPDQIQIAWIANLPDVVTNVFLFIPIGFLFRLSRRCRRDPFFLLTFAFGVILSVIIESAQIFIPGRYTQPMDVLTNGSGAWLGAFIFTILENKVRQVNGGKVFDLELPLMSLAYLLIPLLWLNGLSMGEDPGRLALMLLLGITGAVVFLSIYIYRSGPKHYQSPNKMSMIVVSWFLIGTIPSLFKFPLHVTVLTLLIGIMVQVSARFFKDTKLKERRFEQPILKRVLPLYVVYLILLTFWPATLSLGNSEIVFSGLTFDERIEFTFRMVEFIAAYTLLGYMIAEMRGRKQEHQGYTFGLVFLIAFGTATAIDIISAYPSILQIDILRIILVSTTSLYGAVIYRLQLSAIQRL